MINYTHDGDGRRVKKETGGSTRVYFYGADGPVVSEFVDGVWDRNYHYLGGDHLATEISGVGMRYPFKDHLGSLRVLLSQGGTAISQHDHYPFGGAPNPQPSEESHQFTGQERDDETGLDYFIARHYASTFGRFLQPDPIVITKERVTDPQGLNLYAYARNNPLKFVDPLGLDLIIYVFFSNDLTDEQKRFLEENREAIYQAIAAKYKEAGVENVEFREGDSLSDQQIQQAIEQDPIGVGFLNFANTSIGDVNSGGKLGATDANEISSVVFLGNLMDERTNEDTAIFRISEVAAHELGHGQGIESNWWIQYVTFGLAERFRDNLMDERQSMPFRPKYFDKNSEINQRAIQEINRIGDNPPKRRP
ncbi:MAG: RHS repeat domain-containing protein [Terriglobia bacterium]